MQVKENAVKVWAYAKPRAEIALALVALTGAAARLYIKIDELKNPPVEESEDV